MLGGHLAPGRAPVRPPLQAAGDPLEVPGGHAVGGEPRRPVRNRHCHPLIHRMPPTLPLLAIRCKRMHTLCPWRTVNIRATVNGAEHVHASASRTPRCSTCSGQDLGLAGPQVRLRRRAVRRLLRAHRRPGPVLLRLPGLGGGGPGDHHGRGPARRRHAASGAAGGPGRAGRPVRVLHLRNDR